MIEHLFEQPSGGAQAILIQIEISEIDLRLDAPWRELEGAAKSRLRLVELGLKVLGGAQKEVLLRVEAEGTGQLQDPSGLGRSVVGQSQP